MTLISHPFRRVLVVTLCAAATGAIVYASSSLPPAPPVPLTPPSPTGYPSSLVRPLTAPSQQIISANIIAAAIADKHASRARSLEKRATLRAYEGAPPVIPHSTEGLRIESCRACHAQGLQAGELTAHAASHTWLTSCTQCHVESDRSFQPARKNFVETSFVGLRPDGYGGTRFGAGSPPAMPHSTFMRTNCVSCHGQHGYEGWRPDHLSRVNCVQCHAPSADLDQLSSDFSTPTVFPPPQAR